MNEKENIEQKVVYKQYKNNDEFIVRSIRGIVEETDDFIIIHRRDGELKLNKNVVLSIEKWNEKEDFRRDGDGN